MTTSPTKPTKKELRERMDRAFADYTTAKTANGPEWEAYKAAHREWYAAPSDDSEQEQPK